MGSIDQDKSNEAAHEARQAKQSEPPKKSQWWFNEPLPIDRFTGWLMVYTGLLFLATIINAAVLYKTDVTLHETLIATQRPWVSVAIDIEGPMTVEEVGAIFRLRFTLKNTGHTPAQHIEIIPRLTIVGGSGPASSFTSADILAVFAKQREFCSEARILRRTAMAGTTSLFAGETIVDDRTVAATRDDIAKMPGVERRFRPVVIGCIHYFFTFEGLPHQTGFAAAITRSGSEELGISLEDGILEPSSLKIRPWFYGSYAY